MTVFLHQLALTSQWFHSDAAVIIWCHFKLQMKSLQLGTCILSNTYVAVSIVSFQVAHTNKNWGRIKWLNSLHFTCHDFSPSYHHLLDSQSQLIHTLLMYLLGVSFLQSCCYLCAAILYTTILRLRRSFQNVSQYSRPDDSNTSCVDWNYMAYGLGTGSIN